MNIFFLHDDPVKAAQAHSDAHTVSLNEACIMLSNAHDTGPCKHGWVNHPCSIWVRASIHNYMWLATCAMALADEYEYRKERVHKSAHKAKWLHDNCPLAYRPGCITPPAQAMPDVYKHRDWVKAYRNYYIGEKYIFNRFGAAKWTRRKPPEWWPYKVVKESHAYHTVIVNGNGVWR